MNCCKEYAQTISEYLDGALGESECAQLLVHLEGCEGCRAYLAELAAMRDALSETGEAELPEGFHESVMAKVHAQKRAKKASVWKRYAAVAACAAIVLMGAVRLMPGFGASSAPEAAGGTEMAMMEEGAYVAESPAAMESQSLAGGEVRAVEDTVTEEAKHEYAAETEFYADAEPMEKAEAEAGEMPLPTVRGENVRETLLSLGATELSGAPWLLVSGEVLENLPEGLELVGEYDKTAELVTVMPEEVAK